MLDAAMQRRYSASPFEEFFTGGGMHAFANFEKWEDFSRFTVEEGFTRSINNVFVRVMRDITRYYIAQDAGQKLLTVDREDPNRKAYLRRFIDQDSRKWKSQEVQDEFEKLGCKADFLYLGSGKTFALVGHGFAEAMKELWGRK